MGEFHLWGAGAALSVTEAGGETWHPASTVTLTDNDVVSVAANPELHMSPACRATLATMGTTGLASIVLPPVPDLKRELAQCPVG